MRRSHATVFASQAARVPQALPFARRRRVPTVAAWTEESPEAAAAAAAAAAAVSATAALPDVVPVSAQYADDGRPVRRPPRGAAAAAAARRRRQRRAMLEATTASVDGTVPASAGGARLRTAAENAAFAAEENAPPLPPNHVPGFPVGVDYLELLLTTQDVGLLQREVGWIIDEIWYQHPEFDPRMAEVLRTVQRSTHFLLLQYTIIAYSFSLPIMGQRLKAHVPWHRLEPILHRWRDEFFVLANARASFDRPANMHAGVHRKYTDLTSYVYEMRMSYLLHYDIRGMWTNTVWDAERGMPQPLVRPSLAAQQVFRQWHELQRPAGA